ncbi:hypothetical protein DWZ54_05470 [Mitsuokella sp. AF33-22]|nr:hypothetical protein DWZ54_05470 [Mitsuokella sp. AF33-22]
MRGDSTRIAVLVVLPKGKSLNAAPSIQSMDCFRLWGTSSGDVFGIPCFTPPCTQGAVADRSMAVFPDACADGIMEGKNEALLYGAG